MLRPGGVLVFDTINRSYQSYLLTIVLAQELHLLWPYVLWLYLTILTYLLPRHAYLAKFIYTYYGYLTLTLTLTLALALTLTLTLNLTLTSTLTRVG